MSFDRVGIVSIATNKYLSYYFDLLHSFEKNSPDFKSITFYLFTDRMDDAAKFNSENEFPNVVVVEISNLGWPAATSLRYEIFHEHRNIFETDILVYLDSDMLIIRNPFSYFQRADQVMTFVRHPGFYFENSIKFIKFLIRNPYRFFSYVFTLIKMGGVGSWDT